MAFDDRLLRVGIEIDGQVNIYEDLAIRSSGEMGLKIHALASKETIASLDEETIEGIGALVSVIHEEDIEANEGVWKGLNAGATKQGRLSSFEEPIWQLNQLWLDRMKLK